MECASTFTGERVHVPRTDSCKMNQKPRFSSFGSVGDIVDTPQYEKWEKAAGVLNTSGTFPEDDPFVYPEIVRYKGQAVNFTVSATYHPTRSLPDICVVSVCFIFKFISLVII